MFYNICCWLGKKISLMGGVKGLANISKVAWFIAQCRKRGCYVRREPTVGIKPIWTFPDLARPIPTYLNLSESIQIHPNLFEIIQTYPNLSKPIQIYTNLSKPIRTYPNLSEHIQTYQNISKPIRTYPNLSEHIQTYLNLAIQMGPPRPTRTNKHLTYKVQVSYCWHLQLQIRLCCYSCFNIRPG